MQREETVYTADDAISCDGGEEGHPKIYLNFGDESEIECPYCSRRFVHKVLNPVVES